jgi:AcrR family transcriptional regulator
MTSTGAEPAKAFQDRAERTAETEAAILGAARALLAEGGLDALSMRLVAERVGISATAIYHYFNGKDALVSRVVRDGYRRFDEYVRGAADRHPRGSLERLIALGEGYVRFAFENREYFRVLYSIQARSPRDLEELPGGGGYEVLRETVVEAIEAGTVRESNPDLIAHFLWTCVHGLVTLTLACNVERADCPALRGPFSPVDLFGSFLPFLSNGLAAPASRSTAAHTEDEIHP